MKRYFWIFLFLAFCSRKTEFLDLALAGDFHLLNTRTGKYQSRQELPLPALLFIGYTSCPDVCPLTMAQLKKLYEKEKKLYEKLSVLFLSVDPKRDEPKRLNEYLAHFKLPAYGLTGTKTEIDKAVQILGAHYEISSQKSALGYLIDHSAYIYLLDKDGKVRYLFPHQEKEEVMLKVLRDFLERKDLIEK